VVENSRAGVISGPALQISKSKDWVKSMWERMFKSKLWHLFGLIGDLFVLNVLWLITSLPIVTIGASTTALYYVFLKKKQDKNTGLSNFQLFKKSLVENWKQSTFVWLIYLFLAVDAGLIGYSVYTARGLEYIKSSQLLMAAAVCFLVLYVFTLIYIFPLLAFFQQSTAQCFLNAVGISFKYLFSTLGFVALILAVAAVSWLGFPLLFIASSFIAWLISARVYRIFAECMAIKGVKSD